MTSHLRSDEQTSLHRIEKEKQKDNLLKKGAKTAAGLAATAGGLAISSRILPFLNDLIPVDLALKGISKISPKIGDFLKRGMSEGLNIKDGLNFLKKQITPEETVEQDQGEQILNKIQQMRGQLAGLGQPQQQAQAQSSQHPQQGNSQAKQQLLQAMQALSQKLRT